MNSALMMQSSPHRDVLEANPDTEESKAKLLEELQSRGRAAVGAKSWMDAKILYEKALTIVTTDLDANRVAILNSNLSLVQNNMGLFDAARKSALAATKADPSYVKGWWRLGQSLQNLSRTEEALEALSKAKELEPTNKALIKEHAKVQQRAEEEAKLMKDNADGLDAMQVEETVDAKVATTTATTAKISTTKSTPTDSTSSTETGNTGPTNVQVKKELDDDDEEKIFSKSDAVRGYKVVNGKKTSYFHNELSDEAKSLIGDIAPKKLETTPEPTSEAPGNGVSAWNKAGTWEEKELTKWAKTTLEEHILKSKYILPDSSPAPGAEVTVTKVNTLDGHASCAMARGKKRYIYEFMAKLDWKLAHNNGADLECTGSLALPDIDGTIDLGEGYEIHEFTIDSVSDNSLRPLVERFVQRGGFHDALNTSIDDWVRRFKEEY